MTTPSSPPISLKDVANELGIGSVGLALGDGRVRALAGAPGGPISLHDLLGKSSYTPITVTVPSSAEYDASGFAADLTLGPTSVSGGDGALSFVWNVGPITGGTYSDFHWITQNAETCEFYIAAGGGQGLTLPLQLTVTDSHGPVTSDFCSYLVTFGNDSGGRD